MNRIFLKLTLALVTFTVGVSLTALYRSYTLEDVALPDVVRMDPRFSCFPGLSVSIPKSTAQKDYFPVFLSENAQAAHFLNDWYSRHLQVMNELPLTALVNEDESYRFLWLRSFHRPVSVHVGRAGTRYFMVVKRLNGRGGYDPGTSDLYWARSLSENDWDAFMMHLEHSSYWTMQTEYDAGLTDGAQWILEGYRDGRYHVVDRQSPDGAYRDACLHLLRKSGLLAELPADQVY